MAKQRPGQGSGTDGTPDAKPDPTATTQRPARRTPGANPQHVVERRVTYVRALMVAGYRTAEILQKVAKAYKNEAPARKLHADAVNETDIDKLAALPVLTWGDPGDEPPADRTVHRYIAKAKLSLEDDGKAAARLGDRFFGIQLARINRTWQVALKDRKPAAMVRIIEATNDLFAFDGAVRPQLSALAAGGGERTGDKEPPPDASMTLETAAHELQELLAVARDRRLAQNRTPVPPVPPDPAPSAEV